MRGTLGFICFIAHPALILVARALPWTWVPFYRSYLSRRAPLPVPGVGGRGVLLRILWYAYVTCVHGGVVPACLPL